MITLKTFYTTGRTETTTYVSIDQAIAAAEYRESWECVKEVRIFGVHIFSNPIDAATSFVNSL